MGKKPSDFESDLLERLKDRAFAIAYLTELFLDKTDGCRERLLVGLFRVVQARGVGKVTSKAKLSPKALNVAFSKTGNPRFSTLSSVLEAMDMELTVQPAVMKKAAASRKKSSTLRKSA